MSLLTYYRLDSDSHRLMSYRRWVFFACFGNSVVYAVRSFILDSSLLACSTFRLLNDEYGTNASPSSDYPLVGVSRRRGEGDRPPRRASYVTYTYGLQTPIRIRTPYSD